MRSGSSRIRKVRTSLPCRECGAPTLVERGCRETRVVCPACGRIYPVSEYVGEADEAMEAFLARIPCDRI